MFDRDNDYLADWPKDKKINYVHNWKDEHTWKNKNK